jgi:hypothetical protein
MTGSKMKTTGETVAIMPDMPENGASPSRDSLLPGRVRRVRGAKTVREEFLRRRGTRRADVFVAYTAEELAPLAELAGAQKGNIRLLVLDEMLTHPRREYLETLFRTVVAPGESVHLLDRAELVEVVTAPNRDDLIIGGTVDRADEVLVLYRGNLDRLAVPLRWFERRGIRPDFERFEVTDFGQTVRLGEFEAATDAILYAFDSSYRRRAKRRQIESDPSFGAALRRLRLLRGLSRDDFAPLSARTIARIERGEVREPRGRTLGLIAERLSVDPDEIGTF